MYFKYILFLTLAVASNEMLNNGMIWDVQEVDCTEKQFKCADGKCIFGSWRCDGNKQCKDGSDELNCTSCKENSYRCEDGECIYDGVGLSESTVCDLYDDCEDGSDENNCANHVCDMYEFQCRSGLCIFKSDRCDGINHCPDGSDEENCLECYDDNWRNYVRKPFKCVSSNKCILSFKQCNSIVDCPDGSDEDPAICQNHQCVEQLEEKCRAGNCIPNFGSCIDTDPCNDNHKIDKPYLNCTSTIWGCQYSSFPCDAGTKCVDPRKVCDMVPDCEDGSDESESTCSERKCRSDQFQCQSGQCVKIHQGQTVVCNGHYDCEDESDETNCTTCSPEAFKCGSGECVYQFQLCNSIAECSDGSDENEINCPHGSTPPVLTTIWRVKWPMYTPNVTLQHLTEDLAVYFDSSVSPTVTWPFLLLSKAWKYAKKTFQLETLSEPGSQFLYVVLGKFKPNLEMSAQNQNNRDNYSFRSQKSGYRNIIDPGMRERNGWVTQNSENFEKLVSSLGYIVKIAMEGVENIADKKLCYSTLRNIVSYDIHIHLKGAESADVVQYKANQFNRTFGVGQYNCFRDWYLPVYEKYGGATVLNNYFHIFKINWPKKQGTYSQVTFHEEKQLNFGEFVHFWSGAAGEDLRYLAKSAFKDWNDVFMRQFVKAQTDFPNITYTLRIMSGNHRHNAHLNFMEKSSSHHLRSYEGQTIKTKKVVRNF